MSSGLWASVLQWRAQEGYLPPEASLGLLEQEVQQSFFTVGCT